MQLFRVPETGAVELAPQRVWDGRWREMHRSVCVCVIQTVRTRGDGMRNSEIQKQRDNRWVQIYTSIMREDSFSTVANNTNTQTPSQSKLNNNCKNKSIRRAHEHTHNTDYKHEHEVLCCVSGSHSHLHTLLLCWRNVWLIQFSLCHMIWLQAICSASHVFIWVS